MPFKKDHIPWNKNTKGLCKQNSGSFKKGENIGHFVSLKTRQKIREALLGTHRSKKSREKMRKSAIARGTNPPLMTGYHHTTETKIKISKHSRRELLKKISKKFWQNPNYVKKQTKARRASPNKWEMQLFDILNSLCPNEYKYVGDREVIIAGKCPDFININGQKKIIEFYGDYWHRGENPQERINLFRKYGYQTLIIWGHELANVELLNNRIVEFNSK